MAKRTAYQERIIRRYYQNQDSIMLQRLGEIVSELFLAEGKARERVWKRAIAAMEKLKIPQDRIEHLKASDNPSLVAKLLEELLGNT